MGTPYNNQHSHANHGRVNHIPGIEMPGSRKTSHHLSTAVGSCTRRATPLTGCKVSKPSYSSVATQLHCSLCKQSHRLFRCDQFLDMKVQQRLNHVKQSRLCYNCLQPFTRNHICSTQTCRQCHKTYVVTHKCKG